MYYAYILFSNKLKKHYIGSTENLEKRIKRHNSGQVSFTRNGKPWQLIYTETLTNRSDAYKREREIKSYKGGIQFKKLIK